MGRARHRRCHRLLCDRIAARAACAAAAAATATAAAAAARAPPEPLGHAVRAAINGAAYAFCSQLYAAIAPLAASDDAGPLQTLARALLARDGPSMRLALLLAPWVAVATMLALAVACIRCRRRDAAEDAADVTLSNGAIRFSRNARGSYESRTLGMI